MKAKDKLKYVEEARRLLESLEVESLIDSPHNLSAISKINRLIAIFTSFSSNDGQELKRLFQEYQRWARGSTRKGHIRNRVMDMIQFIGQKIEEMDIYEIEEPMSGNQEKIVKSLKNEKLWVRSSLEGKDLHVQIGERGSKKGEHVHLISDSRTGELRVDADDKAPSELIERVVTVVTKQGSNIGIAQKGIKTTMEFIDTSTSPISADKVPVLYPTVIRNSGGSRGHFVYFTLKNIGKEIALDIKWEIRAFGYEWRIRDEAFELETGKEKEITFQISGERIFTEPVPELNIITEYRDVGGNAYFTRRELLQEKVPSGAFFNLKLSTFHPPSILTDEGVELLSGPVLSGDKIEAVFGIRTRDGMKKITIGISGTLIAVFGFDNDSQIKQAIFELAHRKIRKMLKENNLVDHIFKTNELPEHHKDGFDAYAELRASITQ